ncbi:MAG TPA: sigma-70 family RNA polymerase sigma factor [Candidatus Omnitrophota bacterium]|nr:sigma-70 family RNA polymerase sigma factor [Candidatus Omnitrophota bacterium]HQL41982.1 sigma-70 family RNA polymerase sigma factor [Candidatus Omnitrophota bacterium]
MVDIARETIERAARNDMAAFKEIYQAASPFVYSLALRIVPNSADAQEVTQDVFIKIYHHLSSFRFSSAFKTWIYRITVNTAINYHRKYAKEKQRRVNNEHVLDLASSSSSSDEKALQGDHEAQLNMLLGSLTLEHRACIVLREIEGLNYQQMASALSIPVNTVRSRLKRARQALLQAARKESPYELR